MNRLIVLVALAATSLALGGCGSSGDAQAGERAAASSPKTAGKSGKPNPWASDSPESSAPKPKVAEAKKVQKGKNGEEPARNPWSIDPTPTAAANAG